MATPDCVVYVDGIRLADDYDRTGDPVAAGEPALLSGLTLRWGRDTTIDQPEPGTATMTLLDPPGGRSFAQLLRVGAALTIEATGTGWTDLPPGEPGYGPNTLPWADFEDETFDLEPVYYGSQGNGKWTNLTRETWPPPAQGNGFGRLDLPWAPRSDLQARLELAPGPYARESDPPGAWDGYRRWGTADATWSLTFTFRAWHARLDAAISVKEKPFRGGTSYLTWQAITQPSDGTWRTATINVDKRTWPGQLQFWPLAVFRVLQVPTWADPLTLGPTWADAKYVTWRQLRSFDLDGVELRPDESSDQADATVLVFAGRITDVSVSLEDDEPVIELTAADMAAELGNRVIGDVPWAASTVAVRANKILTAAGGGVTLFVDPGAAGIPVSWMDVDARPALELLQQLAISVDGVLWVGTHPTTGPYLRLEHSASRAPLFRLQTGPGGLLVVVPAAGARVLQVSACDLLAAPARFVQDVADVVTVAAVGWLEQTLDDDGKPAPTERSLIVTDGPAVAALGTRRLSLSTILSTAGAAQTVAAGILARTSSTDYRVSGLLLGAADLAAADQQLVTRLLDGTARNGLPLVLVDLPDWSPAGDAAPLYLEGGTYSYVAGAWNLDLVVSSAAASGVGLPWNSAGAYRWTDFDPAILWRSLAGVQPVTAQLTEPDPDQ